ncbi:GH25 family lysozyme [Phormidium sp. CCY1219]|uniref:GH25 family lysozyme n=1 Tax=Phormidium sp. CCY1219 TaxID=2886104 RepID=UPI002D1EC4FE|nr:GH25 family lysozyme [Phormidium sp. CCY1219]MEB3828613.1 peptidoglycan-binding protein [Phormidium sp. CCY1219]
MCAKGIDVSDWQHPVNWHSVVRDGMGFAFTKATEGATFVADSFRLNWDTMKSVGLHRGAYHFYRAKRDPYSQAEVFLKTVTLEPEDLPPVLDIESTDGMSASSIIADIRQWLQIVEKETNRRPIIYTYPSFWDRIGNPKEFSDYPLWIAHYQTDNPWVPGGWDGWTFWQYTDRGAVSGIAGGVDINWFNLAREGHRGSHIHYVQKCLQAKGFNPGAIDGVFGTSMTQSVKAFQQAMNLQVDGIVGINTWTALMSLTKPAAPPKPAPPPPISIPTPQPEPEPTPKPQPTPSDSSPPIRLIDVCRFYQGFSHQNRALAWLQGQLSHNTLEELTRRWRDRSVGHSWIKIEDLCQYYRGLPHQDQAVYWLQGQLSDSTLREFSRLWRKEPSRSVAQSTSISLLDVCHYYRGLSNQKLALEWLQMQIAAPTLAEFARQWRKQHSVAQSTNIRLVDVCQYYQGLLHQKQAVEWLQKQIQGPVLEDFTRKWRS